MAKLAFIMSGPQGGQVIEMDDNDLEDAITDGWAVDFEAANKGGNLDPFAGYNTKAHPKAEAWLTKRQGGYPTREMRSTDKPFAAPDAEKAKPVEADKQSEADKPAKAKPATTKK